LFGPPKPTKSWQRFNEPETYSINYNLFETLH
jgi:hypothetical protein